MQMTPFPGEKSSHPPRSSCPYTGKRLLYRRPQALEQALNDMAILQPIPQHDICSRLLRNEPGKQHA